MWRLAILILLAVPATGQTVLRVDADAPAGGDGQSWPTAFADLHDALAEAGILAGPVEIWVAAGTYRADALEGDPFRFFALVSDLRLLGGFAGHEDHVDQRDWTVNVAILDGDLNGDDQPDFTARADNTRHILVAHDLEESATLDGFTVRGGYAYNDGELLLGGGALFAERCDIYVFNCIFEDNWAGHADGGLGNFGGAIYLKGDGALEVRDSRFTGNRSGSGGAIGVLGRDNGLPSLRLYDCLFLDNQGRQNVGSGTAGAVRHASGEELTVERCTFEGNDADYAGALLATLAQKVLIRDTSFHANISDARGVVWLDRADAFDATPAVIERCTFSENRNVYGTSFGSALFLEDTIGHVWHCQFTDNVNFRYRPEYDRMDGFGTVVAKFETGHQFVNCLFAGNHAAFRSGLILDSASATITNCTFADNTAGRDDFAGVGLFLGIATAHVDNSVFWGNRYGTGQHNELQGIADEDAQIKLATATLVINHSIVEGWTGALGGQDNLGTDPLFTDSEARDYRLQWYSPAIDAGDDLALPEGLRVDLDGNVRVSDGDGDQQAAVDLGVYEYQLDPLGVVDQPAPAGDRPAIIASQGTGRPLIRFRTPTAAAMRLTVHDVRGRRVAVLVDEWRSPGEGSLVWDGRDAAGRRVPGGVYLLEMKTGRQRATGRVLLLR